MNLLVLFAIGCIEWVLAAMRTVTCAHGRATAAAVLVFCETMLGLNVLQYVLLGGSQVAIVAYSFGCAAGMWVGTYRR